MQWRELLHRSAIVQTLGIHIDVRELMKKTAPATEMTANT